MAVKRGCTNIMSSTVAGPGEISLDTIAAELNISRATVSRALSNSPSIHPRTRSMVMETAARLDYRPQRTRQRKPAEAGHSLVGVLVRANAEQWRNISYLEGMTHAANPANASLVLCHVGLDEAEEILDPARQPAAMRSNSLAGIVLVHRWPEKVVAHLAERFNCVSILHQSRAAHMDVVTMDHHQGILELVEHLFSLGHRRIGFLGCNPEVSWSRARFAGYLQALHLLGLEYRSGDVVDLSTTLLEDDKAVWPGELFDKVAALTRSGVTAWVTSSDWVGTCLYRGLAQRGLDIPRQVSITGFDNRETEEGMTPLLTSVRVPTRQIGVEALRRVLLRNSEPSLPRQTIAYECAFLPGASTGPRK